MVTIGVISRNKQLNLIKKLKKKGEGVILGDGTDQV